MKKNIIALAVVSAFAAPLAMADAPIIYGQINMALEQFDVKNANVKNNGESGTQVNSRNSRIGIKGSEDLGDGLKAIYQLEYTARIDDNANTLSARNQFVGLAGGFGTVLMGRHDTPVKMIQGTDLFDDGMSTGDNAPMAGGLGLLGDGMETRLNNAVAYISPEFAGIKLLAAGSASEQANATGSKSEITDMYSLALTYGSKKQGLYLAVGGEEAASAFAGVGVKAKHARAVVQYAAGGLIANAMYQKTGGSALTDYRKGQNVQANLGYKMGKLMPKVKVSSVDYKNSGLKDATNFGIGLDYALGKKTTTYIEYVEVNNQNGIPKEDTSAVSVGMIHKF